ncbi:hypothetical protein CA85_21700 [Allorhodopirellula solitaria]|uniref:Uncharacterized protein n=1 Tax=Allorhodopirellula solitaria TaxID=2527987 RepID=A0A5C5XWK7_9BACT|nr:hypothetical protein CA85_21700 [Allorhodopirellula solitaria]
MDVKGIVGSLTQAIADSEIQSPIVSSPASDVVAKEPNARQNQEQWSCSPTQTSSSTA